MQFLSRSLSRFYHVSIQNTENVIRSDDGYGLLMKQLPGVNLEALLRRHPQDRLLLIDRFAGAVKALHRTVISDDGFPDAVEVSLALCEQISDRFCSDSERKQIRTIFQRLPRTETFIHGDCHPGNAMWNDGIIQFLDLPFAGKGHPVFDLLGVYSHYVFLPSFETEEAYFSAAGMTKKDAAALYERFLETYYAEADSRALSQIREWIRGVHAAKILLASVTDVIAFSVIALAFFVTHSSGSDSFHDNNDNNDDTFDSGSHIKTDVINVISRSTVPQFFLHHRGGPGSSPSRLPFTLFVSCKA